MGTTTMGVKLDDATRERIKSAASRIDRTPHWLIKQAIFQLSGKSWKTTRRCRNCRRSLSGAANESDEAGAPADEPYQPFLEFAEQILPQSVSRAAITAAPASPGNRCGTDVAGAGPSAATVRRTGAQAGLPAGGKKLRNQKNRQRPRRHGTKACCRSSRFPPGEGVALMCSAEALLRIPDKSHPRRANPRQKSATATGNRISAAAHRCSSMLPPGTVVYRETGVDA